MRLQAHIDSAGYGSTVIVRDVALELGDGQAVAIVGRNGMGKTTLVRAVLGYLRNARGSVRLDGDEVLGAPTHRIIRRGVAYGPQEENLFGQLTVQENLHAATLGRRHDPQHQAAVLEHFPVLAERLWQHAGTLSGGEQKMLVLARALMARPSLLVLDEISDGLQPSMVATVARALTAERERTGVTLLMVEQNLALGLALADRVAVMKRGSITLERPSGGPGAREQILAQLAP